MSIDIFVLVILIGFSIVASVKKKRREEQKKNTTEEKEESAGREIQKPIGADDDPWESIKRQIEEEFVFASDREKKEKRVPSQKNIFDTKPSVSAEIGAGDVTKSDFDEIGSFSYESYDKASMREIEERRKAYESEIEMLQSGISPHGFTADLTLSSGASEIFTEEIGRSNTIEEFDLRKAIIYSEILTPKFKQEDEHTVF